MQLSACATAGHHDSTSFYFFFLGTLRTSLSEAKLINSIFWKFLSLSILKNGTMHLHKFTYRKKIIFLSEKF